MIQESLLFSNIENNNNIILKDKNSNIKYFPIAINDPKDIKLQNIEEDNLSFSYIDELESYYNYFPVIEENKINNILNLKNNTVINNFSDNYIELDKLLINNNNKTFEELIKFKNTKEFIFAITKDKRRKNKNYEINIITKSDIMINKEDKYFPFNEHNGLISYFNLKFYTKKYFVKENGKKKKIRNGRKFKSDNIRKKIKSRFHKELKNILNKNLKMCGSKKFFFCFPQCFLANVSKITNSEYMDLTFKELLSNDFRQMLNKDDCLTNKITFKKYLKNKEILEYLEKNPEISKLSGFSIIKDIKYRDLLKNYFNSAQFEKSILQLKNEKESPEYISKYIRKAKDYVNFYSIEKINKNEKD